MIRIGVVGCGHLGGIHIKLLSNSKNFDLMQIKLSKIEKTSMKIINIFKLLFVIFLSVYVLYFIFYFRKAIKF